MDTAAIALLGVAVGAFVVYLAVIRQWWSASGTLAFGIAIVLMLATSGNHSHAEHTIVLAVPAPLMAAARLPPRHCGGDFCTWRSGKRVSLPSVMRSDTTASEVGSPIARAPPARD